MRSVLVDLLEVAVSPGVGIVGRHEAVEGTGIGHHLIRDYLISYAL